MKKCMLTVVSVMHDDYVLVVNVEFKRTNKCFL